MPKQLHRLSLSGACPFLSPHMAALQASLLSCAADAATSDHLTTCSPHHSPLDAPQVVPAHCDALCAAGQSHDHAASLLLCRRAFLFTAGPICHSGLLRLPKHCQPIHHIADVWPLPGVLRPALRNDLPQRLWQILRQRPPVTPCHLCNKDDKDFSSQSCACRVQTIEKPLLLLALQGRNAPSTQKCCAAGNLCRHAGCAGATFIWAVMGIAVIVQWRGLALFHEAQPGDPGALALAAYTSAARALPVGPLQSER